MQFFATLLALASVATATNMIHFVNQDATARTIYFTANEGLEAIPTLNVTGLTTANQTFPDSWIGNFYSVSDGADNVPGMLGELRWNGYAGATYFDVSAIVNPTDNEGVKMLFPKNSDTPVSGCQTFPCANAYNKWDDIATLSTDDTELVCLLGNLSNSRRRSMIARMNRSFIEA